jgi:hypothetical protein
MYDPHAIGFTGTRNGMTALQIYNVSNILKENHGMYNTFIHGDCVGADAESDDIAYCIGFDIKMRPCNIIKLRAFCKNGVIISEPIVPLIRNKKIVEDSDIIIACPKEDTEVVRSGTWSTIRYSTLLRKKTYIIYPNGTVEVRNG